MQWQNYVTERIVLQDNGSRKGKFSIFALLVFSTLEEYNEKTYEKTYFFITYF